MPDTQQAVARALGHVIGDCMGLMRFAEGAPATVQRMNVIKWKNIDDDEYVRGLPDPSDPRVYEKVIKRAIERPGEEYTDALTDLIEESLPAFTSEDEMMQYRVAFGANMIAEATPEQRLTAALRVLGELE